MPESLTRIQILHRLWEALGAPEEFSDFQEEMVIPLVEMAEEAIHQHRELCQ